MSETTLGRALEFMRKPQDVEVNRGGDWVLGSMVGWRREEGSSCRVMVRVSEGGVEKTAWADLHDVRLPEERSCPRTQSLPLLPRLPRGQTDQTMQWGTGGGWHDLEGPVTSADSPWPLRGQHRGLLHEPVTPHVPGTDAATGRASLVSELTAGRHRAPAGIGSEVEPAYRTQREHEAALVSGWPSSGVPTTPPGEVEPTRLMTLPSPNHWQAVAPRYGVVVGR